jgi:hypothetical protein
MPILRELKNRQDPWQPNPALPVSVIHRSSETDQYGVECDLGDTVALGMRRDLVYGQSIIRVLEMPYCFEARFRMARPRDCTGSVSRFAPGMTIVLRIFAWLLAVAVTFVTVGPPNTGRLIPISDRTLNMRSLSSWSGSREVLQLFAPGRHARIEDFAVDALAACAGFAPVALLSLTQRSPYTLG